ncbi:FxsA family protein [Kytococcus sedentarius]|uniref:FxsA family protein n=1 Tax=Kytococcus sedentarius TaxID=1276 RepID=UPI0035BBF90D
MSPRAVQTGARRRRKPTWLVVLSVLLLVMPMAEVAAILAVGRQIGAGWTIGLLILWSTLGAWIVTREGSRTWKALKHSLGTGHELSRQLTDAALVLVGGTLLLAPGFITDAMGLFLVLPFTRPLTRRVLQRVVEKKLLGGMLFGGDPFGEQPMGFGDPFGDPFGQAGGPGGGFPGERTDPPRSRGRGPSSGSTRPGDDEVLEGEILDDRP